MPAFHIVVELLKLRLLLASLSGLSCSAYDFGYHPSAEEFDSLLRSTRTWTRDLMANERRESFVPRYTYHEQTPKPELNFELFSYDQQEQEQQQQPFVYESVPELEQQPQPQQADQQQAQQQQQQLQQQHSHQQQSHQSQSHQQHPHQQQPHQSQSHQQHPHQQQSHQSQSHQQQPHQQQHVQSDVIKINAAGAAPATATHISSDSSNSNINSSNSNNFPIFFTNPATGIVYAISEVGSNIKAQPWSGGEGNADDAIAIYVTKAQYDADMLALRRKYELQCAAGQNQTIGQSPFPTASATSTPSTTTPRPHIIRLQKPKKSTLPAASGGSHKLPHKPPPVMVSSGNKSPISGQLLKLPTSTAKPKTKPQPNKTQKPKRRKKKKKKPPKRRPGYKLPTPTPTSVGPQIVVGKRTTSRPPSGTYLATQLEKPHMPQPTTALAGTGPSSSTIFSAHPFAVSSGYMELPHRLRRRSVNIIEPAAGARPVSGGRPRTGSNGRGRPSSSGRGKSKTRTKSQSPEAPKPAPDQSQANRLLHTAHAVHLLHGTNSSSKERGKSSSSSSSSKERDKNMTRRRSKAKSAFELLDLMSFEDYEDKDDSYYDNDEPQINIIRRAGSRSTAQPNLENSSSAEEDADFGALEEQPNSSSSSNSNSNSSTTTISSTTSKELADEQEQSEETQSSSKLNSNKKRIRRRPSEKPENSDEDYYDDNEDNEDFEGDLDTDSGVGSFLRMIFYPVQVAMSRLFDGFSDEPSEHELEATPNPKYPSYTMYHSAHSNKELDDDTDNDNEDDSGFMSNWFSSWFGSRRRTKRIGSTTAVPLTPAPLPTPTASAEPPSWLESWFGFGKTTTEASSEEDDYDKWFAGWFDNAPKARRQKTTTSTTTTTTTPSAVPQVPILTIVDPLRNPQNWIGILAHHIVNSTGGAANAFGSQATTKNPLLQALVSRVTTSPTTAPPEVMRRITYDKYQIWRLKPQDEPQLRALEQFKKGEDGVKLQWLKGPSLRGLTDVLVPPKMLVDFQGTLDFEGIAHEVLIFDVGKAIAYERTKEEYLFTTPLATKRPTQQATQMTWNKYYEHDDILKYLETIRMRHTQLVELIHIGRSYEGRPLIVVKIESKQTAAAVTASAAASHKRLKHKRRSGQANAVFIEAGAQAQAWIGPASATWIISELLRQMRSNKSDVEHEFIRNTTWYIMPMLNPDGYVYSHDYDRFWKKSRSQHVARPPGGLIDSAMTWLQQKTTNEKICFGVDLDRNWLNHWSKRGSSKAPCNEFYAGPAPFSEPETKAVSEFLMDYRTQIKLYISLQAYGQIVSYPVKANSTYNTERLDDFLDVAMVGTDSLRKKGSKTRYKVDSANDLIEQRSGCADAFAVYDVGIPFGFTLQLADNGIHGFLLPSSAIESTARDAFEIISGMLDYI